MHNDCLTIEVSDHRYATGVKRHSQTNLQPVYGWYSVLFTVESLSSLYLPSIS